MADTKITALTALTAADPINDAIPIVDVSDTTMAASGTTKRISVNNILGASGVATLASATITGDLTVATSSLKVTGGNASIGTATPNTNTNRTTLTLNNATWGGQLDINVGAVNHAQFGTDNFSSGQSCRIQSADGIAMKTAGGMLLHQITSAGVFNWYDGAGGTRMTLNSTGLGLGVSPVTALSFPIGSTRVVAQSAATNHAAGNVGTLKFGISDGGGDYSGLHVVNSHNGTYSSQDLLFFTGEGGVTLSLERMRITRSGNLILQAPSTPATLTTNGQLTVNATSNTNLRFSYRGSDGTTRVANITLA
jgi:hypothetical protein